MSSKNCHKMCFFVTEGSQKAENLTAAPSLRPSRAAPPFTTFRGSVVFAVVEDGTAGMGVGQGRRRRQQSSNSRADGLAVRDLYLPLGCA